MAHLTKAMEDCLGICDECRRVCLATMTRCLEKGGAHAEAGHIRALLDCAEGLVPHRQVLVERPVVPEALFAAANTTVT